MTEPSRTAKNDTVDNPDRRQKNLSFARENSTYNREWFFDLKEKVEGGEPYAYINADVPTEIFKAMDLPVVVNQWWSAVVSAKQKSAEYLGILNERGYGPNLCQYCSLGFASSLARHEEDAPWGGLPVPTVVVSSGRCGSDRKIFDLWAREHDIPFFCLEQAVVSDPQTDNWVERGRYEWEAIYGKRTIDTLVEQYRELIDFLEIHTGRTFDRDKLAMIMEISNEQEEYYASTRELIARTSPAPLNIADQIPGVMIPQWHRGTEWGRDRARLFYEETRRKVEAGEGVVEKENARLMWLGTGLWHNLAFYEHFQKQYGAVFVWSIYLAIASDGYPTYGDDPLRALAGRMTKIFGIMYTLPLNTEWIRNEIHRYGIDGVVSLHAGNNTAEGGVCQQNIGYNHFLHRVLEETGVPICYIGANTVDSRSWDDERINHQVADFLESRVLT